MCTILCVYVCLFLGTTLYRHFSLLRNPSLEKLIIIIIIHFCESKCVTTILNYYSKKKSALSISYDAISSTDISYHKCNIIVLMQN